MKLFSIILTTTLCLCLGSNLSGQVYYNKTIDIAGSADIGATLILQDSSAILFSSGLDSNAKWVSASYQIGLLDGVVSGSTLINDSVYGISFGIYGKGVFQNATVQPGIKHDTNGFANTLLVKTLLSGDTIWMKEFDLGAWESTTSVAEKSGYYYSTGFVQGYDGNNFTAAQGLLLKTDTNGVEVWNKLYGNDNRQYDDVIETADQNLLMVGYCNDPSSGLIFTKTDTAGNVIWDKRIFTGGFDRLTTAIQLADSNIVLAGLKNDSSYVACINLNGEFIWETNLFIDGGIFNAIVLDDGSIIACGEGREPGTFDLQGTLTKICPLGRVQWTRYYGANNFSGHLYDVKETDDGGFVACGSDIGANSTQDIWVLRVDSLGCSSPNCDSPNSLPDCSDTIGISENTFEPFSIIAFPNPTNGIIAIEINENSFHGTFNTLKILNSMGQIVLEKKLTPSVTHIDLSKLGPKGLYIIEVYNAQLKFTEWKKIMMH